MALGIKTKPAKAAAASVDELKARKADYLATADAADREAAELRADLDELTLSPDKHRARFVEVAAAEDRAKRLREMAAGLDAEIAGAEKREADALMLAKSDELRREAAVIAKLVADLYRRAAEFARDCDRVLDFLRRLKAHNQHLREAGKVRKHDGERMVRTRRAGFEDVSLPRDPEAAVVEGFLDALFIPEIKEDAGSLFRGPRHRVGG